MHTPLTCRQMRAALRTGVLLLASAALSGCSWTSGLISSEKIDYKSQGKQTTAPSLELPPDLTAPTRDGRFDVPGGGPRAARASDEAKGAGRPASTGVLPAVKDARHPTLRRLDLAINLTRRPDLGQ